MMLLSLADGRLERCRGGTAGTDSLRAWLADRWAVLFSHPEDFAQEELEMDRWISILERGFGGRGVAPVALARAGCDPEQGWLGRLAAVGHGAAAVLMLDPAPPGAAADLPALVLRTRIARSGPRFALVIDPDLHCRRAFGYRARSGLPSPLDLIGWAVALRKRDGIERSPRTPDICVPVRSVWAAGKG